MRLRLISARLEMLKVVLYLPNEYSYGELTIRKKAGQLAIEGDGRTSRLATGAWSHSAHQPWHRGYHRRRNFRCDRPSGQRQGRRCDHAIICHRWLRMRFCRALLRGIRRHGAGRRLGLHLRLRHSRRAVGLDHRLGSAFRIRRGRSERRARLVPLFYGVSPTIRHRIPSQFR